MTKCKLHGIISCWITETFHTTLIRCQTDTFHVITTNTLEWFKSPSLIGLWHYDMSYDSLFYDIMIISCHDNTFCITGPFCGTYLSSSGFLHKKPILYICDGFFFASLKSLSTISRVSCDLRHINSQVIWLKWQLPVQIADTRWLHHTQDKGSISIWSISN